MKVTCDGYTIHPRECGTRIDHPNYRHSGICGRPQGNRLLWVNTRDAPRDSGAFNLRRILGSVSSVVYKSGPGHLTGMAIFLKRKLRTTA